VTLLARLRGLSTLQLRATAAWRERMQEQLFSTLWSCTACGL
jgi:hypothetical protein